MTRECQGCFRVMAEIQFGKRRYGVVHKRCNQCRREDQIEKRESPAPLPAYVPDPLNHEMAKWSGPVEAGQLGGML